VSNHKCAVESIVRQTYVCFFKTVDRKRKI